MNHKVFYFGFITITLAVLAIHADWIGPELISNGESGTYSQYPSMAVDSTGQVFVAWAETSSSDSPRCRPKAGSQRDPRPRPAG